jgi:hypothetical protein
VDDAENWQYCTVGSKALSVKHLPLNYQLRFGREQRHEELAGLIADDPSESNQRGFYAYWSELMSRP